MQVRRRPKSSGNIQISLLSLLKTKGLIASTLSATVQGNSPTSAPPVGDNVGDKSNMAKLTIKELEALSPADIGRTVRDGDGLSGRVRANARAEGGVSVTFTLSLSVGRQVPE
ncbi:hypothetical protein ACTMU2_30365 [Cupriavidus basilensis]